MKRETVIICLLTVLIVLTVAILMQLIRPYMIEHRIGPPPAEIVEEGQEPGDPRPSKS